MENFISIYNSPNVYDEDIDLSLMKYYFSKMSKDEIISVFDSRAIYIDDIIENMNKTFLKDYDFLFKLFEKTHHGSIYVSKKFRDLLNNKEMTPKIVAYVNSKPKYVRELLHTHFKMAGVKII